MRTTSSRIQLLFALAVAVAAAACHGTSGESGKVDFTYDSCLFGCSLGEHSLAAGGAREGITATPRAGVAAIGSVASSNTQVVSFTRGPQSGNAIDAISGMPGAADLIISDGLGLEIDRATVIVKETTTLDFDNGWGSAQGPTVLEASPQELHTTTKNGSEILFGSGAVKFTLDGTLKPGGGVVFGDTVSFAGDAGSGNVSADCLDSHIVVPVTVVAKSALTAVELTAPSIAFGHTDKGTIGVTAKAGGTPVFGADCSWNITPAGLTPTLFAGGEIGVSPTATWQFSGPVGSYSAVCTIPGGLSATVAITVQ